MFIPNILCSACVVTLAIINSILCILGELPEGGSVGLAVGVSDR